MYEQQAFYNGEPIDFNNLDLWDKFKVTFGLNVTEKTKPNGKKNFNFKHCGFSTFITSVDGVGGILAKWFANKHKASVPCIMALDNSKPGQLIHITSENEFLH